MIRYTLKCKDNHSFESWFQSAEAFEKLKKARMVVCAVCGGVEVEKAIMSPRVRPARTEASAEASAEANAEVGAQAGATPMVTSEDTSGKGMLLSEPSPSQQALADLRAKIEATSEDVGTEFAREARAIHDGDAPSRRIIGQARAGEARSLIEDGIPVAPLPWSTRKTN